MDVIRRSTPSRLPGTWAEMRWRCENSVVEQHPRLLFVPVSCSSKCCGHMLPGTPGAPQPASPTLLCTKGAAFDRAAFARRGLLPSVQKQCGIPQRHKGSHECEPNTCQPSHARHGITSRSGARLHLPRAIRAAVHGTAGSCNHNIHNQLHSSSTVSGKYPNATHSHPLRLLSFDTQPRWPPASLHLPVCQ